MIIKRHRFHGHGSLKRVYANGGRARAGQIGLRFSRRDNKRPYRVAVVVSRKVSKSAVTRNRIRRRIYEQVRQHKEAVPSGTDLVFTAFDDTLATVETDRLEKIILELLQKATS